MGKKENKVALFVDVIILFLKTTSSEKIRDNVKLEANCSMLIQCTKLVAVLYTNNEYSEYLIFIC